MAPPLAVRRQAFAMFIRRALLHAQTVKGWSVPQVAAQAGIGTATVYRWRDGTWADSPSPERVVAFCDALDIPPQAAFNILWPGKNDEAQPPQPMPMEPDFAQLLRRLADPSVSESTKETIRTMVRTLLAISPPREPKKPRR